MQNDENFYANENIVIKKISNTNNDFANEINANHSIQEILINNLWWWECIYLNDCVCWFLQVGDMLLGASYTPRPLSTNAEVALPPAPLAELVQQS